MTLDKEQADAAFNAITTEARAKHERTNLIKISEPSFLLENRFRSARHGLIHGFLVCHA